MIASVRSTIPRRLSYEIIVVDNGSTDGTDRWAKSQADIFLIQLGQPRGAVHAFTEGAYAAEGDYVLLATDDVTFPPHAITRALVHMEATLTCGAVAFQHNKYGDGMDVDYVRSKDGRHVPYPQIALVRRRLGDVVGWWGGRNNVMSQAFTYGGDNFLGAGIWSRGYTVCKVNGVYENEHIYQDTSRQLSRANAKRDGRLYHSLYPDGVPIGTLDTPPADTERLRVLLAVHYDPNRPQHKRNKRGWREAWDELGHVVEYDFAWAHAQDRCVSDELADLAEAWQPHIIFAQVQNTAHGFNGFTAQRLRYAAPNAVMVNVNGDYWRHSYLSETMMGVHQWFDVLGCTDAAVLSELRNRGVNAVHLLHAYEPVGDLPDAATHEIVFLGNGYSPERQALAKALRRLNPDAGLYGSMPGMRMDGNTLYDFALGRALYANADFAVSPMQFDDTDGYVSNRLWEIMVAGGAVALQQRSPGLEDATGIVDGEHVLLWDTLDDLADLVEAYRKRPNERARIACQAQQLARERHSFRSRVQQVLTYVEQMEGA
jgi:hypothetical protein